MNESDTNIAYKCKSCGRLYRNEPEYCKYCNGNRFAKVHKTMSKKTPSVNHGRLKVFTIFFVLSCVALLIAFAISNFHYEFRNDINRMLSITTAVLSLANVIAMFIACRRSTNLKTIKACIILGVIFALLGSFSAAIEYDVVRYFGNRTATETTVINYEMCALNFVLYTIFGMLPYFLMIPLGNSNRRYKLQIAIMVLCFFIILLSSLYNTFRSFRFGYTDFANGYRHTEPAYVWIIYFVSTTMNSILLITLAWPSKQERMMRAAKKEQLDSAPEQMKSETNTTSNVLRSIEKLADLRDKGMISSEEFEDKKSKLLEQI